MPHKEGILHQWLTPLYISSIIFVWLNNQIKIKQPPFNNPFLIPHIHHYPWSFIRELITFVYLLYWDKPGNNFLFPIIYYESKTDTLLFHSLWKLLGCCGWSANSKMCWYGMVISDHRCVRFVLIMRWCYLNLRHWPLRT